MKTVRKHLHASKVHLRVTRAGWVFLLVSILVGFAASQSEASLMFVLFGVMIGAMAVSTVLVWTMVSAVRVWRDFSDRAWANQTVHLAYHLRNIRRRCSVLSLRIEEIAPEGIDSAAGYCVHLPGRSVFRAGSRFTARHRGRIRLRGIRISTSFPFGLIVGSRTIEASKSLVVWPGRGSLKRQLLHRGAVETSSAAPSGAQGGQDEFFGLREYRPGDNPRWIHWRHSANKETPVVIEMARPLPEILWVVLDTCLPDRSDQARLCRELFLRFATTLIDHAFSRGYRVGLALGYSEDVRLMGPGEGRGHRYKLLDALADVDLNTRVGLDQTVAKLHRGQLHQGQVIVLTPQAERLKPRQLNAMRSGCRYLSIFTEKDLPAVFEDHPFAAPVQADAT